MSLPGASDKLSYKSFIVMRDPRSRSESKSARTRSTSPAISIPPCQDGMKVSVQGYHDSIRFPRECEYLLIGALRTQSRRRACIHAVDRVSPALHLSRNCLIEDQAHRGVAQAAVLSTTRRTVSVIPRMHGCPFIRLGFHVMRSKSRLHSILIDR